MKTFKTNLNCANCVARATNTLNNAIGQGNWSVDTSNAEKTLTVINDAVDDGKVIESLKRIGFEAERIK